MKITFNKRPYLVVYNILRTENNIQNLYHRTEVVDKLKKNIETTATVIIDLFNLEMIKNRSNDNDLKYYIVSNKNIILEAISSWKIRFPEQNDMLSTFSENIRKILNE